MSYSLGIDFGTSTTKVALRHGQGIPTPLPIGQGGDSHMPSVVAYGRTGRGHVEPVAIGEDAAAMLDSEETCVVREIKRCLATADSPAAHVDLARYRWWNSTAACVEFAGSRFSPEDVILRILSEAVDRSVRKARELGFGTEIDEFTVRGLPTRLGCPVSAGLEMRQVLAEVARRLGFADFKVSALREEPVLASLAYAHLENVEHGGIILVYDLGGGSFDTAVVQMHRPVRGPLQLTVLAADGEPFCGGVDIDEAFFEHMTTLLAQQNFQPRHRGTAVLKPLSPRQEQAIRNRAQIAKESLSTQNEALVVFPPRTLDASAIELRVSRQNLEATIQETKLLDKTLECVLRAWRRARMLLRLPGESIGDYYLRRDPTSGILAGSVLKLGHADLRANVQRVLLVGGTTRTPFFRQHISALWGADKLIPESVVQPMEAAAVGAAWQDEDVSTIVDRLPFSIALRWNGGNAEQYRAFAPTVQYRTLTANPQVYPYRGRPADIPPNCDHATVELRDPGGHILEQSSIRGTLLSGCFIEIDSYGTIGLNRAHERLAQIPNPVQHQLQRDAWERLEAERKGAAAARAERERKLLRRNVFLEND